MGREEAEEEDDGGGDEEGEGDDGCGRAWTSTMCKARGGKRCNWPAARGGLFVGVWRDVRRHMVRGSGKEGERETGGDGDRPGWRWRIEFRRRPRRAAAGTGTGD